MAGLEKKELARINSALTKDHLGRVASIYRGNFERGFYEPPYFEIIFNVRDIGGEFSNFFNNELAHFGYGSKIAHNVRVIEGEVIDSFRLDSDASKNLDGKALEAIDIFQKIPRIIKDFCMKTKPKRL